MAAGMAMVWSAVTEDQLCARNCTRDRAMAHTAPALRDLTIHPKRKAH